MSRTDKDRPAWIKKFDPAYPTYVKHDHTTGECIEETLDGARNYGHWRAAEFTCYRSFVGSYGYQVRHIWGLRAPASVRRKSWDTSERRRVRDTLRHVAHRYNAGDDITGYDFPNNQHRHECEWWWL